MTTTGEAVVGLLEQYGVGTVFGIPGVHTLEIYRGLAGSGIRHVTPRHEQGAGFMADAWGRVTGEPGVCFLISGPGVTNALTPVAQAYHDSRPLLVISSVVPAARRGEGDIHDLPDQRGLTSAITAFSHTVTDPAELPEVLARAYDAFTARRPRPVHIEIPVDVLKQPAGALQRAAGPPARPEPTPEAVRAAAAQLAGARRPLVILGGGALAAGAEAIALAERLDAPIGLSINAKGTVPDSHPLCLGPTFTFSPVSDLLREADALLVVGAELSELDLWALDAPLEPRGLIRVDIDAGQLDNRFPAAVGVQGDAAATLRALLGALDGAPAPGGGAAERVRAARAAIRWPEEIAAHRGLIDAIDAALPDDRIVAGDSTQPVYTANHCLPVNRPGSWLMPIGYGCLGCALPMAIGAKLAAPDRPVVAIAGDGGVLFSIPELATARDLGLALPLVVYDNRGYGEIRDSMDRVGVPHIGTDVSADDFAGIAHGFGCHGEQAGSLAEVTALVRGALDADRPTLIHVTEAAAQR